MTDRDRLPAGIYLSPRHDDMVVMVDAGGFPRPVAEDYNTLISHNGQPDHLAKLWGPLTPAKVVPADAIVIPRSDLPEVTVSPGGRIQARGATLLHGTATGSDALGWLAIEEHLNPPVDEAAVDALTALIRASDEAEGLVGDELDDAYHRTIARHLVKSGVRAPQAGDHQ